MAADSWTIINEHCDPQTLSRGNSVFTVTNGYLAVAGNVQEDREGPEPLTIINGVYDALNVFSTVRPSASPRPWLDPRHFDEAGPDPAVANLPDPLHTRIFANGSEVVLSQGRVEQFRQVLDMRAGIYHYGYRYTRGDTSLDLEMVRFASLRQPHQVYLRYRMTAVRPARVVVHNGINCRTKARLVPERQYVVVATEAGPRLCRAHVRTRMRQHDVHAVVAASLWAGGSGVDGQGICAYEGPYVQYQFDLAPGQTALLDRVICLSCSEDKRHAGYLPAAAEPLPPGPEDFDRAAHEQRLAWEELWRTADAEIVGDDVAQRCLRFCMFHLLAAAPRFSNCLSVPVKLLSGDYYQGNVFYDTDLYVVPFYTFTRPELARTCLAFRHAGLNYGRAWARTRGWRGAKLAWQAGPYGEECLGPWHRFGETNIHINAAVAWSLMQYLRATGDREFLLQRGIDLLVESARFYTSRATWDKRGTACDLRDVTGPDEAHCGVDTSFYTNYTASRTLKWAVDTVETITRTEAEAAPILSRLSLRPEEIDEWRRTADGLKIPFDQQRRVFEQCHGFFKLPAPPPDLLERRREWFVALFPYQALNQPDVLMALTLFRDDFEEELRGANWQYYKDKNLNLSSMSFAINAIMAADLGEADCAYQNFIVSAGMDLDPTLTGRNDTHQGLHGTAMGGAWLALMLGFAGLHLRPDGLEIEPNLPPGWERLRFSLMLRGRRVFLDIDQAQVRVSSEKDLPPDFAITVTGRPVRGDGVQRYHS